MRGARETRARGALRAATAALVLLLALPAFFPSGARGYVLLNSRRPNGAYVFDVGLSLSGGTVSPSGPTWDAAFTQAAGSWNAASALVDLQVNTGVAHDSCVTDDGIDTAQFTPDVCGTGFGSTELAIARRIFSAGGGYTIDGAILFKDSVNWDVYAGALKSGQSDFRRVAVHELGHLLGLDHESVATSIMNPTISDLELPQPDDVDGLVALYDLGCPQTQWVSAGVYSAALDIAHCFDTEDGLPLPAGGGVLPQSSSTHASPNAFVDVYRIAMPSGGQLTAELTSPAWNPVVQLLDSTLSTEIDLDWAPKGIANTATISRTVAPGNYAVVVRSVFTGGIGSYTLTLVPEPTGALLGFAALASLGLLVRARSRF